ncbi:MAG TPA: glycosyltransferase family 8 protein [Kiloniellaceae bacterium]|nr:glycosyltransferase family 8 protein [Kiloniellaceae bacterium]
MEVAPNSCEVRPQPERVLHVAAACNAAYAMPMATMLSSLAATLDPARGVALYILNRDLEEGLKEKVERAVDAERVTFHWIGIEEERFASLATTIRGFDTVSLETYYRLLLPEVLPASLDRVIYLDCDLVVLRNLGDLWDLDMAGSSLFACPELLPDAAVAAAPQGIRRYGALGLASDMKLFNAGVLLINLKYWRDNAVYLRALIYVRETAWDLRWHDQEALNVVLAGSWQALDPLWNVTMHVFTPRLQPDVAAALVRRPGIVHFNSAIKPWHPDFAFGFRDRFFQYLDMTPWSGWRPGPPSARGRRVWATLCRALKKRQFALARSAARLRASISRWRSGRPSLVRLDGNDPVDGGVEELRAFVIAPRLDRSLDAFLEALQNAGVDRVFVVLDAADIDAGAAVALGARHAALHIFRPRGPRRSQDALLRELLDRFGEGRWCLLLGLDERLTPFSDDDPSLKSLCRNLDDEGFDALLCEIVEGQDRDCECGPVVQVATVARDPLSNRLFPVSLLVELSEKASRDSIAYRSKVPLFKYRRNLGIAENFRAVQSQRLADFRGTLLRLRDQS